MQYEKQPVECKNKRSSLRGRLRSTEYQIQKAAKDPTITHNAQIIKAAIEEAANPPSFILENPDLSTSMLAKYFVLYQKTEREQEPR